jgi:hypothetical protein
MSNRIKSKALKKLIEAFNQQLILILEENYFGLYIYNSVAREEFDRKASDINFLVITHRAVTQNEKIGLRKMHRKLVAQFTLGKKLDGIYINRALIGKVNDDASPYPYVIEGRLEPDGYYDLNVVTWWSLKQEGLNIASPDIKKYLIDLQWEDVHQALFNTMTQYWDHKIKDERLFLEDEWVEFSVFAISRIVCSLKDGKIVSKGDAYDAVSLLFPQWQDVLKEAMRLRERDRNGVFDSLVVRKNQTVLFLKALLDYGYQFKNINRI